MCNSLSTAVPAPAVAPVRNAGLEPGSRDSVSMRRIASLPTLRRMPSAELPPVESEEERGIPVERRSVALQLRYINRLNRLR